MASVEIYTQQFCPYCHWAKELLSRKGVGFDEIDVTGDTQERQANGRSSVPQIFIGSTHVGGCDELYALEDAGKLDGLLSQSEEKSA
jgi:glutaredoxin 3